MKFLRLIASSLVFVSMAQVAFAACTQSSISGNYKLFNKRLGLCKISLDSSGSFQRAKCDFYNYGNHRRTYIEGKIKINRKCTLVLDFVITDYEKGAPPIDADGFAVFDDESGIISGHYLTSDPLKDSDVINGFKVP